MDSIYGEHKQKLKRMQDEITELIDSLRIKWKEELGEDPVEHSLSRIKSEESMREKLRRKGLPEDTGHALFAVHDALGFRIVCAFVQDVYRVRDALLQREEYSLFEEKDYIKRAKPNGYRSLHLVLKHRDGYYVEFQLRTISMDTWAALEHHLKYKKELGRNTDLIVAELKRCADELASTDLSLQTLRDTIREL